MADEQTIEMTRLLVSQFIEAKKLHPRCTSCRCSHNWIDLDSTTRTALCSVMGMSPVMDSDYCSSWRPSKAHIMALRQARRVLSDESNASPA